MEFHLTDTRTNGYYTLVNFIYVERQTFLKVQKYMTSDFFKEDSPVASPKESAGKECSFPSLPLEFGRVILAVLGLEVGHMEKRGSELEPGDAR